jgi:signal transduction histidine kinase
VTDDVLAPVLREAVTNILRHAAATNCVIELTAADAALRLHVGNDGVRPRSPARGDGQGLGLANLDTRVRAAGGRLTIGQADGRFGLTVELPLDDRRPEQPWPAGRPRLSRPGWREPVLEHAGGPDS